MYLNRLLGESLSRRAKVALSEKRLTLMVSVSSYGSVVSSCHPDYMSDSELRAVWQATLPNTIPFLSVERI